MKRKFGITVSIAVVAFLVFSRNDRAMSQPPQERIRNAVSEFRDVVRDTPTKRVGVVAFFVRNVSLEELRDTVSQSNVLLKGFRHGTLSQSGGYSFSDGETVDEAILSYRRDHQFFLEKRLEIERPMAASTATQPELREAFANSIRIAEELQKDFAVNGLSVIGADLDGEAIEIEKFRKANPFIRVMELKKKGRIQPSILPSN